jgi:hypothetical protein
LRRIGEDNGGVLISVPSDWKETLGSLAKFFHFSANEVMEMEIEDIIFWADRMKEQNEAMKRAMGKK